jgi:hypothetical protein
MNIQRDRKLGRISALILFTIAAAVSIRGMSTTTSAPGEKPATAYCHVCNQHGGAQSTGTRLGGGGGGTITITP